MINFIKNCFKKSPELPVEKVKVLKEDSEIIRFLKGLLNTEESEQKERASSEIYTFDATFKHVDICVRHFYKLNTWRLEIWAKDSINSFIYTDEMYNGDAIELLDKHYLLTSRANSMRQIKEKALDEFKEKYLR